MKNYYDLLKVFAIFLVVVGHIAILYGGKSFGLLENRFLTVLCSIIYLFHMPLFFSLSGAVYQIGLDRGKYSSFSQFLKNKILRLVIPFLFVGALFLALTLYYLKMTNGGGLFLTVCNVVGCFGEERHLWYLPALFWIFMFAYILNKSKVNLYAIFIVSVFVALYNSLYGDFNFICFSNAIYYAPFFIIGMIIQKNTTHVGGCFCLAWF